LEWHPNRKRLVLAAALAGTVALFVRRRNNNAGATDYS
jgi:hypothetical protein